MQIFAHRLKAIEQQITCIIRHHVHARVVDNGCAAILHSVDNFLARDLFSFSAATWQSASLESNVTGFIVASGLLQPHPDQLQKPYGTSPRDHEII